MMTSDLLTIGWREWLALPDLALPAIKAKVDTGAKTSALHAFKVERVRENGRDMVDFLIHPLQKNDRLVVRCRALLLDQREVSDSGGHKETRYAIETRAILGPLDWSIVLTLTNRDSMRFRMLLGRRAMDNRILIDPTKSYICDRLPASQLYGVQAGE